MAEARSEEEEESLRRESREQVVRRQPNSSGGRPDRRKPEHRHSQGPLSSIRAVIKRTTRPISVAETSRDQERDRDRVRDRDRRRPEITILSAEPLPSTSWFPGTAGGIPPPPPPPAQIWGSTIHPSIQPPPSYEEVIREKTQEQVVLPSSSPSSSSSSSSQPVSTTTIATQTDTGSAPDPKETQGGRTARPPRPPLPNHPKPSSVEEVTQTSSQSALASSEAGSVASDSRSKAITHTSTDTQCCDLLTDLCLPSTSTCGAQTDQWDQCSSAVHVAPLPADSSHVPSERPGPRPRPRPRTKLGRQPVRNEVKVQTLVKLREDGLATLAARASSNRTNQEGSQGKYYQELLEAFTSDDWGSPDQHSDSSDLSLTESDDGEEQEDRGEQEDREEQEDGEDMATLRARIQAFEQQMSDGSCGDGDRQTGTVEDLAVAKKPEPRPRPRLQGQPAKSAPPVIAPKPKNLSPGPKPSKKEFWEDEEQPAAPSNTETETPSAELNSKGQTAEEPSASCPTKSAPSSERQPSRTTEKPSVVPKPQSVTDTSTPVPAPRPPPPKLTPSISGTPSPPNPRPPPRPVVAPRASPGAPVQDKNMVEVGGGAQTESGGEAATQTVRGGSVRSSVPIKPALTSSRRSSAPNLAPKPISVSPAQPDPGQNPVPARPASITPAAAPKPSGPAKPPTPAPTPAIRKGAVVQTKAETANPANPKSSDSPCPSSAKLLPLRPPPIKSVPERPPPPVISQSPNRIAAPKPAPAASTSPGTQLPQTASSPPAVTSNQTQAQRAPKRGPPLPPRPKPGHPLYSSYMKQDVLIVLDDPTPEPPELHPSDGGKDQTSTLISPSQCLLNQDPQPEPVQDQDSQSKPALEDQTNQQSILSAPPAEQKEPPDPLPVSGPRCVALFDYEGEEDDELTFSQGDVIALLELADEKWGRGQIHGRVGAFPLNFTEVVEPLPATESKESTHTADVGSTASVKPSDSETEEWVTALFDFPGQTADDLSFHKGALIQVVEHVDEEWRRGRLEGREGLYPVAFTQPSQAQPITSQQSAVKGTAKALFEFTAENQDELTLKVGDIITQVESVDEQWILGVVGGKRGIVPKNYISFV